MSRAPEARRFSLLQRLQSFRHAGRGLVRLVAQEHNARIHLAMSLLATALGGWLGLRPEDWRWLIAAVAAVWMAEAFNTALERLCDRVSPEWHPLVRDAKDMAAAAVLLASVGAALVGVLTLVPYLPRWA